MITQNLAPLLHQEYRFYILMRFFYTMALRMVATLVAYQLFQLTRTSLSIGLVGLSEFIPVMGLALYAGHVIDYSDKRTLLLKWVSAYAICVMALILVTFPGMEQRLGIRKLEFTFYLIIFFTGIVRAFAQPAYNAIIVQLIPRDILHLAANIGSGAWLAASIIGHASAGFFIAWFGVHNSFYIVLLYVLIAAYFTSRIKRKEILNINTAVKAWDSVKEGLRFVFHHKVLLSAISLDLF
ncbi:MAG TPA: MFS transporter, partial [Flavisolibacter sp.]|nr:MFS transporter [Flavisolibacter sp.]